MIGERIKKRSKDLGLKSKDLAQKANLSTGYLSQICSGKRTPALETIQALAKALETSVSFLMEETDVASEKKGILRPLREQTGLSIEEASKLINLPPEDLGMMEENEHLADDVLKQKLIKAYGKYLSHRDGENGISEKGKSEEDLETLLKMLAAEDPDLVLQFRHVAKNIDKIHPKDKEFLATLFKAALGKIELEDHTDEY